MKHNKKTVVYARTSSKKQKLDLQLEAAKPFLKEVQVENVIILADEGASASAQRKGFHMLLDLIRNGEVETLVAFDRNRLTRNLDEYLGLVNLINLHQVKVVFSATGCPSYNDPEMESIYAHLREMERVSMSNRIKSALKAKQA